MKEVPVEEMKVDLNLYLEECQSEGPIAITQNGKTVAVLLAPRDEEDLERLMLARSPHFQALLERSRRSIAEGKGLARDEFWQAVKRRHQE